MFKKDQKGVIDPIFIIVLVLVLVVGGFIIYRMQSSKEAVNSTESNSTASTVPELSEDTPQGQDYVDSAEIDTSNWVTEDVNGDFTFKHPTTFSPYTKCTNAPWVYARYEDKATDPNFSAANAEVKTISCGGFGDVLVFSIESYDGNGYSKSRDVGAPTKLEGNVDKISVDGVGGEKICVDNKTQPIDGGPTTTRTCQYSVKTDDKQIWANYTLIEGADNTENVFDKVFESIDFTK